MNDDDQIPEWQKRVWSKIHKETIRRKKRPNKILSAVWGFFVFMGLIGTFYWWLLSGLAEDILVIIRLKKRPAMGKAVWRWNRLP